MLFFFILTLFYLCSSLQLKANDTKATTHCKLERRLLYEKRTPRCKKRELARRNNLSTSQRVQPESYCLLSLCYQSARGLLHSWVNAHISLLPNQIQNRLMDKSDDQSHISVSRRRFQPNQNLLKPRGGVSCSLETKKDQMWLLYPQSKNKCCLFSSNPEQRTHLEGADKPHLISLSLVTILSLAAIQVMKACFGIILRMLYLYYLVQNIFNGCKIR